MQKPNEVSELIRRHSVPGLPSSDPIDTVAQSFAPKPKRDTLLTTREATHGKFPETARVAQELKATITQAQGWVALNPAQREALDLICTKVGRILSGDPKHKEHWDDIVGYGKLGAEACE